MSPPSHVKDYSPCPWVNKGFFYLPPENCRKNRGCFSQIFFEISKALFNRKIIFSQPLVPLCPQTAYKIIFLDDLFTSTFTSRTITLE